jgi:hypothetical protein
VPTRTAAVADPAHHAGPARLFRAAEETAEAERALALAEMPTAYILCRGERHALEAERGYGVNVYDVDLGRDVRQVNWAWRKSTCSRCGYEVETWYDQVFRRVTSFQKHPEGYLLKGMGRAHPAEARRELWQRDVGKQPTPAKSTKQQSNKAPKQ